MCKYVRWTYFKWPVFAFVLRLMPNCIIFFISNLVTNIEYLEYVMLLCVKFIINLINVVRVGNISLFIFIRYTSYLICVGCINCIFEPNTIIIRFFQFIWTTRAMNITFKQRWQWDYWVKDYGMEPISWRPKLLFKVILRGTSMKNIF